MRAPQGGGDNRYDLTVPHGTLLYRLGALEKNRRLIGAPLSVPPRTRAHPCIFMPDTDPQGHRHSFVRAGHAAVP